MRHSRFEQRGFPMGHSLARSALVELKQRFSSMGFGRLAWSREDHVEHRLVGGLEHGLYDFPYIGKFIIPTDELIFCRGVETTTQYGSHSVDVLM